MVDRDEFCFLHAKHFAGQKIIEKPKPIAKESKKRKEENKAYKKIVKGMIAEDPVCELKSPVCTGKAQGADHLQKRSPSNLTKRNNLKRACNACNGYKENNPKWAKANGHSISRFKKSA